MISIIIDFPDNLNGMATLNEKSLKLTFFSSCVFYSSCILVWYGRFSLSHILLCAMCIVKLVVYVTSIWLLLFVCFIVVVAVFVVAIVLVVAVVSSSHRIGLGSRPCMFVSFSVIKRKQVRHKHRLPKQCTVLQMNLRTNQQSHHARLKIEFSVNTSKFQNIEN